MSSVLSHRDDRYDGVVIDAEELKELDDTSFTTKLKESLEYWKSNKRRGVWLKIPIEKASFIPIAVLNNFIFHHAEKDYVMLNTWLSPQENRMPPNASHQVGVGCVVRKGNKLLLVQESSGPLRGKLGQAIHRRSSF